MPITNRDLPPGTTLTANFKKAAYTCKVATNAEGKTVYVYAGKEHTSPSAAGSAVMGGISCNGWLFWSVVGEAGPGDTASLPLKAATGSLVKATKPDTKRIFKQVRKVPNQKGVEAGLARWHCSACMKGFALPEGETPEACPEGHPREVEDEVAPAE